MMELCGQIWPCKALKNLEANIAHQVALSSFNIAYDYVCIATIVLVRFALDYLIVLL